jgi:uncharacterized coiled-coil DUF342 family protein
MAKFVDEFGSDVTNIVNGIETERDRLRELVLTLQKNIINKDTEIIALRAKLKASQRELAKANKAVPKPTSANPNPAVKRKPKKVKRDINSITE